MTTLGPIAATGGPLIPPHPTPAAAPRPDLPFAHTLGRIVSETDAAQKQVVTNVQQLATGESDSIQDVVLAAAKADLAFRFLLEVRNRVVATYQEVMRMQV